MPPSEFTLDRIDPALIYAMLKGEPGTRKSTQALSFPLPQYWFSWDRKMSGILVPARKWGIDMSKVKGADYDDWNSARAKLESMQVNLDQLTLVFDSLTSCADMTLRQTLKLKSGTSRKSGATAGKQVAGIAVNEIEDYNAESAALQELIALTKDIQQYWYTQGRIVNIILIAHVVQAEYRTTPGASQATHISRTIITAGKKVAPKIPAYCSEVYHFNIKKSIEADALGQYSLFTEHTGDDFARTALDLPREIVFNDKPLYQGWIKPAIEKLRPSIVDVNKVPQVSQPSTNLKFEVD